MTEVFHCGSLTSPTLAYVTYQDLRRDSNLKDQTVIVVRAPSETKLEVPDPQEVSHNEFGVFLTVPLRGCFQIDFFFLLSKGQFDLLYFFFFK